MYSLTRSLFFSLIILFMIPFSGIKSQVIGLDLMTEKDHISFPYDLEQGFMIVDVKLGGIVPLRMIFDTGAENTILFDKELAEVVNVKFERDIKITGSDLDTVLHAKIARNVMLKLENCPVVSRDIIVIEHNEFLLREKLGFEINGILGGSFFSNLIIRIDNRRRKIHFFRPEAFDESLRGYTEIPIEIIGNKPYLVADVATVSAAPTKTKLLLDTGAALPFLLHTNSDSNLVMPDRTMLGTVGFGLSGPIRGVIGKSEYLKFGEYYYENIITSFQDVHYSEDTERTLVRNGILGNLLLNRFDIYIDYTLEKLYIKGRRRYNRDFDYDKSGMSVLAFGPDLNQFMIGSVINGSPSAEAGLKPGDVITKINGRRSSNLSLQGITGLLSMKEDKKIRLIIMRGEEELKKEFRLKDWYLPTGQFGY